MTWDDWTKSTRSNTSPVFDRTVDRLREIIANARVGDDPGRIAGLIVAHLAHKYHFIPSADTEDLLFDEK